MFKYILIKSFKSNKKHFHVKQYMFMKNYIFQNQKYLMRRVALFFNLQIFLMSDPWKTLKSAFSLL